MPPKIAGKAWKALMWRVHFIGHTGGMKTYIKIIRSGRHTAMGGMTVALPESVFALPTRLINRPH